MEETSKESKSSRSIVDATNRLTGRIRGFYCDTIDELKKCTWPTGGELIESTLLVLVSLVLLALFVMFSDFLSNFIVNFLIG